MTARTFRLCLIVAVAAGTAAPSLSRGASRAWTGRDGTTMKAELVGVKNGVVVLRSGRQQRHFVPLPHFVLDDRDYIVKTFQTRKKPELIAQLLAAAVRQPLGVSEVQATPQQPSVLPQAVVRRREESKRPTELYGLALPSPVMLELPDVRVWTDLLGRQVSAQFESLNDDGNVTLRNGYRSQKLPLAAFVREDIEYIQQALKDDLEVEVFPESELLPLTAEQTSAGYRVWTDRRGVKLNGKFVRRADRTLVLEVASVSQEFPYYGLSQPDRDWITQETERRAAAARAQAEAAQRERAAMAAASPRPGGMPAGPRAGGMPAGPRAGGMPAGPGFRPSRPSYSMPEYQFRCDECGHSWTNSTPLDHCPNCKDTYRFHCFECGHRWTRKNQSMDKCPKCSNGGGSSLFSSPPAGTGNSSRSGSSAYNSSYETGYRVGRFSGFGALAGLIGFGIRWLLRRND